MIRADRGGYRPKEELFDDMRWQLPWTDPPSAAELEAFWRSHYPASMVPRSAAREILTHLRSAGLRLGVVTNGRADMQTAKLAAMQFQPFFDAVIISEAAGVKKPYPEIYELALRSLACPRDGVLFVGDNPVLDVVGPAKAGLRTAWLKLGRDWPPEHPKPDYIISSLDELKPILT